MSYFPYNGGNGTRYNSKMEKDRKFNNFENITGGIYATFIELCINGDLFAGHKGK